MFLSLPQQQALQKNQILVLEVLELENLAVERRENMQLSYFLGNSISLWFLIIYLETYLQHGFTHSTIDGEQRPQCLICSEILAIDSMKPVKLKEIYGYKACGI
jgi:hypothetical protein